MASKNNCKSLPFFYIKKDLFKQRIKSFVDDKYPSLCHALEQKWSKKEDTRSIWYTRDHIAKLLEEIDHAGGNGLRMYFGTYEKNHPFAGQTCLVASVTRKTYNGGVPRNSDVTLENEPDYQERFALYEKEQAFENYNFGAPCPPRCDESDDAD